MTDFVSIPYTLKSVYGAPPAFATETFCGLTAYQLRQTACLGASKEYDCLRNGRKQLRHLCHAVDDLLYAGLGLT